MLTAIPKVTTEENNLRQIVKEVTTDIFCTRKYLFNTKERSNGRLENEKKKRHDILKTAKWHV